MIATMPPISIQVPPSSQATNFPFQNSSSHIFFLGPFLGFSLPQLLFHSMFPQKKKRESEKLQPSSLYIITFHTFSLSLSLLLLFFLFSLKSYLFSQFFLFIIAFSLGFSSFFFLCFSPVLGFVFLVDSCRFGGNWLMGI